MRDASQYEILYDLPRGEYSAAEVGGIRTKTIRAGASLEVECYPLVRVGAAADAEYTRRKKQRACQEALNRKNAAKRMTRLIEANFDETDSVVTLTYDYGALDREHGSYAEALERWEALGLPMSEEDARRDLNNYWRRLKTRVRQKGFQAAELKDLYVMEPTKEPRDEDPRPLPAHWHFHCVIHAPGLSREDIKAAWPHGTVHEDNLSLRNGDAARLGAYMAKGHSTERIGQDGRRMRRWGHSRNLVEPEITVSDRKVSRRRAAMVARDVQQWGRDIFEQLYPGYRCVADPEVKYSDFMPGAAIYARLRRVETTPPWQRSARRDDGRRGT